MVVYADQGFQKLIRGPLQISSHILRITHLVAPLMKTS